MSLNTAHTPDGGGIILYNGEQIFLGTYVPEGVIMSFKGTTNPILQAKKSGEVYLTTHRMIFKVFPHESGDFRSFSIPFHCLRNVKLEQPIFGANYLAGTVLAQPGGNWEGSADWKMTFNKGGCIEYGMALLEANDRANNARPMNAPPPYVPPVGDYYAAPPDYNFVNDGTNIGFRTPVQTFPNQPAANTVFVCEEPPPYPGINPEQTPLLYPRFTQSADPSAPPPYQQSTGQQAGSLPQKHHMD